MKVPHTILKLKELLLWLVDTHGLLKEESAIGEKLLCAHLDYYRAQDYEISGGDGYGSHVVKLGPKMSLALLNTYGDEDRFTEEETLAGDVGICAIYNERAYVFDLRKEVFYVTTTPVHPEIRFHEGKRAFYFWQEELELSLRNHDPKCKWGRFEEKSETWASGPRTVYKLEVCE